MREPDWSEEIERVRSLVHDLRNPVGAIQMATELLQGPLAVAQERLDPAMAASLSRTLEALACAVDQVVHLVQQEQRTPRTPLHVVREVEVAANSPTLAPPKTPRGQVEVVALLRKLEILIVTRSHLPALIAVQCAAPAWLEVQGAELLRALSNLVENAIEASARSFPSKGPWTVDVACRIEDGGRCVFCVSNTGDPPPDDVMQWVAAAQVQPGQGPQSSKTDGQIHGLGLVTVRRILNAQGGGLEAEHKGGRTEFRAWIDAQRVHRTKPTPG